MANELTVATSLSYSKTNDTLNRSKHICTCKDGDEKLKIDAGLKQTAADPQDENTSSALDGRCAGVPKTDDLRPKIIQSIKDLPPMPQVVIRIQHLISNLNLETKKQKNRK